MPDHTALTTSTEDQLLERVLIEGDLQTISPQQRLIYYKKVCESLGLNPFTKPFAYIKLNNKLTLYALRDATDQLRQIHGVSVTECVPDTSVEGLYIVRAKVKNRDGRLDEATGAVTIKGLTGDALCNAIMKAETKAKRRATLSVCGLGWLDETETDTIPNMGSHGIRGSLPGEGSTPSLPPDPGVQSAGAVKSPPGVPPATLAEPGLDSSSIVLKNGDGVVGVMHIIEPEELEVGEVMPAAEPVVVASDSSKAPSPTPVDKLEAVMAVHKMTTGEVKALSRGVCKAPYGTLTPKQRDTLAEYIIANRTGKTSGT